MGTKKKSITLHEAAFYLFFMIMFGMRMWGIYESKPLYAPLLVVGFLMWGISIISDRHTVLDYMIIAAFMGLACVVYLHTGEKGLLLYFALMLGMKSIDIKRLFRSGIFIGGAGMAILSFLSAFGIIEDISFAQLRNALGAVFRRSLGFPHPNTLSSSFTIIAMMIMFVVGHDDRKRVWRYSGLMLGIGTYLYMYSGSRTGLLTLAGFLALNIVYTYRRKVGAVEKAVVALLFPVIWVVTILVPFVVTPDIIEKIRAYDYNFGSRYEVASYFIENNSISLFGIRLNNPEGNLYGIDFSQLYLLLQLGLVAFAVVTALWIMLLRDEVKCGRIGELIVTVSLIIMGISDPFLYNIGFKNLAFAFMGVVLYKHIGYWEKSLSSLSLFRGKEIQPLKIGNAQFSVPVIIKTEGVVKPVNVKNTKKAAVAMTALFFAVALLLYIMTPTPEYVLADRNCGEKSDQVYMGLEGSTYTGNDIAQIKREGNFVIDYTDENELMYVYYADQNDPIPGGFYAPNAAVIEKLRRSVSVFFWGIMAALVGIKIVNFLHKHS